MDRFWLKVDKTGEGGCWVWTAGKFSSGYGAAVVNGRTRPAHRVSYELVVGDVPDGLQLDHLCRNRSCVNPAHLEPVTCRTNLLRGETLAAANAAKTHCPQGHPYDDVNTYVSPGRGLRHCRECMRRNRLASYHRRKKLKRQV